MQEPHKREENRPLSICQERITSDKRSKLPHWWLYRKLLSLQVNNNNTHNSIMCIAASLLNTLNNVLSSPMASVSAGWLASLWSTEWEKYCFCVCAFFVPPMHCIQTSQLSSTVGWLDSNRCRQRNVSFSINRDHQHGNAERYRTTLSSYISTAICPCASVAVPRRNGYSGKNSNNSGKRREKRV